MVQCDVVKRESIWKKTNASALHVAILVNQLTNLIVSFHSVSWKNGLGYLHCQRLKRVGVVDTYFQSFLIDATFCNGWNVEVDGIHFLPACIRYMLKMAVDLLASTGTEHQSCSQKQKLQEMSILHDCYAFSSFSSSWLCRSGWYRLLPNQCAP